MSALDQTQERNARALEVAGRMVGELIGDIRAGMFDQQVNREERERRRTVMAEEFADLTRKVAARIVTFI